MQIKIKNIQTFNLADTLTCGQCFRWVEDQDGWWKGIAGGHPCAAKQQDSSLLLEIEEGTEEFWRQYFDLDRDYPAICRLFSQDSHLAKAIAYAPGIHILHQDRWEALASFILSQNNNIKRIQGIIQRLCAAFGEPVEDSFSFPTAERLSTATLDELSVLRAGFRAKYLLDAARKVASGGIDLQTVAEMPIDKARQCLMQIYGVGPKVADCALLYGFGRMECFPADVWIKRVSATLYPHGLPAYTQKLAGIAQQYLFHYVRNCPSALQIDEN